MTLTFGSLFAGVGGFDLGFERAGMRCIWQVEIDQKCQDVLARHWPDVARYGDIRDCGAHNLSPVGVITFGSPCQDMSVAGKRKGLNGERSGLFFEAVRIIRELRPAYAVWENVPGALSSNGGRDFGAVLDALAESGALDVGWRILDAQWFGVAQRRRRVFVVADFGGRRSAEILSIPEGRKGDIAPSRETGEGVAAAVVQRIGKGGFTDPVNDNIIAQPLRSNWYNNSDPGMEAKMFVLQQTAVAMHETGQGFWQGGDIAGVLRAEGENRPSRPSNVVAYTPYHDEHDGHGETFREDTAHPSLRGPHGADNTVVAYGIFDEQTPKIGENVMPTLRNRQLGGGSMQAVGGNFGVRRLTPTECECLQGFPDGWTDGQADSARYRQLGNAVCVPVAEWIGKRIIRMGL